MYPLIMAYKQIPLAFIIAILSFSSVMGVISLLLLNAGDQSLLTYIAIFTVVLALHGFTLKCIMPRNISTCCLSYQTYAFGTWLILAGSAAVAFVVLSETALLWFTFGATHVVVHICLVFHLYDLWDEKVVFVEEDPIAMGLELGQGPEIKLARAI